MTTRKCAVCIEPAAHTVVYISRRTREEKSSVIMCHKHCEDELRLSTSGLSMVDIDFRPVPE